MPNIMAFFLLVPFLFSCKARETGELKTVVQDFDAQGGMELGVGYDGGRSQVAGKCIDGKRTLTSGVGQLDSYKIQQFENYSDVVKAFKLSPSLGFSFTIPDTPVTVSPKLNLLFGRNHKINKYNGYLLVTRSIQTATYKYSNPVFSKSLSSGIVTNAKNFLNSCGDQFLSAETDGGEFYALIEVNNSTEISKKDFELNFKSGIELPIESLGKLNVGTGYDNKSGTSAKSRSFTATIERRGGSSTGSSKLSSIEEVKEQAELFAKSVALKPVAVTGAFETYDKVVLNQPSNFAATYAAVQKRKTEIQRFMDKVGTLGLAYQDARANLEFALANSELFENFSPGGAGVASVTKMLEDVNTAIASLQDLTTSCKMNVDSCKNPDAPLPVANVPDSIRTLSLRRKDAPVKPIASNNIILKTQLTSVDPLRFGDSVFGGVASAQCYLLAEVQTLTGAWINVGTSDLSPKGCPPSHIMRIELAEGLVRSLAKKDPANGPSIRVRIMEQDVGPDDAVMEKFVVVDVLTTFAKKARADRMARDPKYVPGIEPDIPMPAIPMGAKLPNRTERGVVISYATAPLEIFYTLPAH